MIHYRLHLWPWWFFSVLPLASWFQDTCWLRWSLKYEEVASSECKWRDVAILLHGAMSIDRHHPHEFSFKSNNSLTWRNLLSDLGLEGSLLNGSTYVRNRKSNYLECGSWSNVGKIWTFEVHLSFCGWLGTICHRKFRFKYRKEYVSVLFRCFECFEGRSSEIFLDGLGNQKLYFRIHNQQLIIQ